MRYTLKIGFWLLPLLLLAWATPAARGFQPLVLEEPGPEWLIDIRPDIRAVFIDELGSERADLRWWTPLEARFRVDAWFGETYFGDVTELASYSVNPPDSGVVVGPGLVRCQERHHMSVTAEWNGMRVKYRFFSASAADYTAGPVEPVNGGDALSPPPVAPSAIKDGVFRALNRLTGTLGEGLVLRMQRVAGETNFRDGTGSSEYGDQGGRVAGISIPYVFGSNTITVSPTYARDLKAIGEGAPSVTPDGDLKPAVKAVVHELLHGVAHEPEFGGLDDDALPEGDPKNFQGFHDFESLVLNNAALIVKQGPPDTPAKQDRLRNLLAGIARWYGEYAKDQPGDDAAKLKLKAKMRELLKRLGLDDTDNDNVPEWIEELLTPWGLVPKDWFITDIAD